MSYKSLFTVITDSRPERSALTRAAQLATAWQAHLDVLCLGVDRSQSGYFFAGANALVLQDAIARASEEAQALEQSTRDRLSECTAPWDCEAARAPIGDVGRHVAAHARFSDLVVLPQPYGADCGIELEPVIEGALYDGHAPVLVLPPGTSAEPAPERVVIGWNESGEALRTVRAALPLLRDAREVSVVVIDPPSHGADRPDPGGRLARMLARHGVQVEVEVLPKTLPRVSDVLLRHATDRAADLLVMGAYGHSRFREAILGGATRDMLEAMHLPVFMAH